MYILIFNSTVLVFLPLYKPLTEINLILISFQMNSVAKCSMYSLLRQWAAGDSMMGFERVSERCGQDPRTHVLHHQFLLSRTPAYYDSGPRGSINKMYR